MSWFQGQMYNMGLKQTTAQQPGFASPMAAPMGNGLFGNNPFGSALPLSSSFSATGATAASPTDIMPSWTMPSTAGTTSQFGNMYQTSGDGFNGPTLNLSKSFEANDGTTATTGIPAQTTNPTAASPTMGAPMPIQFGGGSNEQVMAMCNQSTQTASNIYKQAVASAANAPKAGAGGDVPAGGNVASNVTFDDKLSKKFMDAILDDKTVYGGKKMFEILSSDGKTITKEDIEKFLQETEGGKGSDSQKKLRQYFDSLTTGEGVTKEMQASATATMLTNLSQKVAIFSIGKLDDSGLDKETQAKGMSKEDFEHIQKELGSGSTMAKIAEDNLNRVKGMAGFGDVKDEVSLIDKLKEKANPTGAAKENNAPTLQALELAAKKAPIADRAALRKILEEEDVDKKVIDELCNNFESMQATLKEKGKADDSAALGKDELMAMHTLLEKEPKGIKGVLKDNYSEDGSIKKKEDKADGKDVAAKLLNGKTTLTMAEVKGLDWEKVIADKMKEGDQGAKDVLQMIKNIDMAGMKDERAKELLTMKLSYSINNDLVDKLGINRQDTFSDQDLNDRTGNDDLELIASFLKDDKNGANQPEMAKIVEKMNGMRSNLAIFAGDNTQGTAGKNYLKRESFKKAIDKYADSNMNLDKVKENNEKGFWNGVWTNVIRLW